MRSNGKSFARYLYSDNGMLLCERFGYLLNGFDIDVDFGVVKVNERNIELLCEDLGELYIGNISKLDNIVAEEFTGDVFLFLNVKNMLELFFGNDALIDHILSYWDILHIYSPFLRD